MTGGARPIAIAKEIQFDSFSKKLKEDRCDDTAYGGAHKKIGIIPPENQALTKKMQFFCTFFKPLKSVLWQKHYLCSVLEIRRRFLTDWQQRFRRGCTHKRTRSCDVCVYTLHACAVPAWLCVQIGEIY